MAKKTVGKTSKKASVNFNWNNDKKSNKKTSKQVNKLMKKVGIGAIFGAVLLLAIGAVGGFFGFKFLTKNDCFELIGKDEITLQLNETYTDEGAKIISFGKDVSEDVVIETNLKQDINGKFYAEVEGTYYIVYKSSNFKYNSIFKVQKIRLITFVEATEQEEIENVGGNA